MAGMMLVLEVGVVPVDKPPLAVALASTCCCCVAAGVPLAPVADALVSAASFSRFVLATSD
jgi:hypothetical protein